MSPEFNTDEDLGQVMDEAFVLFAAEFNEFLEGKFPNRYIYGDDIITVYARKATRTIQGAQIKTLDIATITIAEKYQNRGLGTRVINHIHRRHPFRATYVESILNDALYDRLDRSGWKDAHPGSEDRNLFKMRPLTN